MNTTNRMSTVALVAALGVAGWATAPSVQAQGAAGSPRSAAKPLVDDLALQLLKQMDAAYKALGSYQSAIKVEEFKGGDVPRVARTATGTLLWRRPNLFAVTLDEAGTSMSAASDGTTLFASTTTDKTRYTRAAAPKDESALTKALANSPAATLMLPSLLSGKGLVETLGLEGDKNTTTLSRARSEKIGGEEVDVVLARQSGGKTLYAFALGKTDHLLRQVKVSEGGSGRPFTLRASETISEVKAAAGTGGEAAAQSFAFTPAAGAEQVLSLQGPRYGNTLKVGGRPFDFTAPDLAGQPLNLDQYKGKVVLIDFWATWCPPCREEMPNILTAYSMYHDEGFEIVGVSLDNDPQALQQYIQENGIKWRQVFDGLAWKSRVPGIYEVKSIPFSVLLGRDGKIAALNPRGGALRDAVEDALGSS